MESSALFVENGINLQFFLYQNVSKFIGSFWLAGRHPRNPVGILQVKTGESDPRQYPYAGYRRELFTPLPPLLGVVQPC